MLGAGLTITLRCLSPRTFSVNSGSKHSSDGNGEVVSLPFEQQPRT
jgi:hypothetical protein